MVGGCYQQARSAKGMVVIFPIIVHLDNRGTAPRWHSTLILALTKMVLPTVFTNGKMNLNFDTMWRDELQSIEIENKSHE